MSDTIAAETLPLTHHQPRVRRSEAGIGLAYGIAAYAFWGIVAAYFKLVAHVAPLTVLAHRIAWSIVVLLVIIAAKSRWREVIACVRHRKTFALLCASTIAIAINWFIFIWSVANNQLLAASLGYFINPLFTVTLGVIVLGERLRIAQTIALIVAIASVIALIIFEHRVPFVALGVAGSFSIYGLLRKKAVVAPTIGLFVETMILLPFALIVIGRQVVAHSTDAHTYGLLALSGLITAIPLIWFSAAARRLRLTTMGFLQYLSPTGQFLLGRFVYHEPLNLVKLACFGGVWMALLIFTSDSVHAFRRARS